MALMDKPLRAVDELAIPLDLSAWVPAAKLRDWIMSDVATLNWTNPELLEFLRKNPEFEPKALLNTMTYAYAVGVLSAEDIVRRCSEDIDFRGVRPKLPPISDELKKFRKDNRAVMKWSLVNVISRALKSQFVEGEQMQTLPPGLQRLVIDNATERLELARHLDRGVELM